MEKMRMESVDMTQQNIEKIAALFPNCITEAKGEDGKLKSVVNFELLHQMLSSEVLKGDEAYEFTWVGKKAAIAEANRPTRKTLRPCPEESVEWNTTENLYIEGDNLEVLKILQESYLGKVKMIYIDPPYNTGHDFVYPDSFIMNNKDYNDGTGYFDDDGNVNFSRENSANAGRYHSDWCTMIYSRLMLARNLLSSDGVIFISIDYHEVTNLKNICNEVFSESNFVGEIIWQTATDNNPSQISMEHEYVICYAKSLPAQGKWLIPSEKAEIISNKFTELSQTYGDDYEKIQRELRVWVKQHEEELKGASHYTYVDSKGVYYPGNSSNTKPGGYRFDIIHPITKKVCKKPDYGYRWTEKTFWDADKRGDVEWGKDENTIPKIKKRIDTVTEMLKSYYYEDNRIWTKHLNNLFGGRVFENPKSVNLIIHLAKYVVGDDDIIMDFFSGSATTAHAIMEMNSKDHKNRKYIMVQLPEKTDEKSQAYKKGFANICEIGKERIRKTGQQIKLDSGASIDYGFRVFRLDESNMKDVYYSAGDYYQNMLGILESNIKPDRTDLDLLFGCLLEWGLPISFPYDTEIVDGYTVHIYNDGDLIACFDENIPMSVIKSIAKRQPLRAVFRDSSFVDSPSKINLTEVFKLLSPDTRIKVL